LVQEEWRGHIDSTNIRAKLDKSNDVSNILGGFSANCYLIRVDQGYILFDT
jgi:flavorubredoxin